MLPEVEIVDYWKKRAAVQGEKTVGFANQDMAEQDLQYQQRRELIFGVCPTDLSVLDYGCGIGRYAPYFPEYTGIDITLSLLEIASKNNPGKRFLHQKEAVPDFTGISFSLFFTATVLQHCAEEVVFKIFNALRKSKQGNFGIFLYENSDLRVDSSHVRGRPIDFYRSVIEKRFFIKSEVSASHLIHGEEHSALFITV